MFWRVKPDVKPRWTKNALSLDGWMCRGSVMDPNPFACEGSLINVPIDAYLLLGFMTKSLCSVRVFKEIILLFSNYVLIDFYFK